VQQDVSSRAISVLVGDRPSCKRASATATDVLLPTSITHVEYSKGLHAHILYWVDGSHPEWGAVGVPTSCRSEAAYNPVGAHVQAQPMLMHQHQQLHQALTAGFSEPNCR
jgi:hypothetical protein